MGNLQEYKTDSLQRLAAEKKTEAQAILANEDLTDEQIESAETLATEVAEIEAELASRTVKASKVEALRTQFSEETVEAAEEAPEDDEEDEDEDGEETPEVEASEEEVVEEAAAPEVAAAAKASSVETLAAKTARPKPPATRSNSPVVITAAANVPDFATGQRLDSMDQVGEALVSRMRGFSEPSGDGKSENLQKFGVAKFKMEFPEELTVDTHDSDNRTLEVFNYAAKESRLSSEKGSGSLVAAGGWCAPSETTYDLCVPGESLDGILSLPEVNVRRGGIRFTKGPDFSDIYTNVGFLQTEAQAIAGTAKTCYEVPCPSFTDVRMDAIGICIKAPILTNAAYPELVQRWLSGSMVAHAHKVNATVIARMATSAGTAEVVTDFNSTTQTTLSALELLANYKRQTYKMGLSETLEVVVPFWVKSAIRDDLSLRGGISFEAVTDAMIQAHFAARHLNVQFVYDWQELDTSNATEGYTATYTALIYPAGTFVKGTSDVITLNAVYDAASLATNIYTALFFEQGLLVANVCASASAVTLPVCNSGRTGIADISACGLAVA